MILQHISVAILNVTTYLAIRLFPRPKTVQNDSCCYDTNDGEAADNNTPLCAVIGHQMIADFAACVIPRHLCATISAMKQLQTHIYSPFFRFAAQTNIDDTTD